MAKKSAFPLVVLGLAGAGIALAVSKKSSASPASPALAKVKEDAEQNATREAAQANLPPAEAKVVEQATASAVAQAASQPSPDYAAEVARQTAAAIAQQLGGSLAAIQAAQNAAAQTVQQNSPPPAAQIQPQPPPPAMPSEPLTTSPGWPTGTVPPTATSVRPWPSDLNPSLKPATWMTMPPVLQDAYIVAAKANTPTAWSSLAYQLDQQGFKALATQVRGMATAMSEAKPSPPPAVVAEIVKQAPGISPQLATAAATVLRDSSDPKVLDNASKILTSAGYPAVANQVQAKSDAVKVATAAATGIKEVENIMKAPPPPSPVTPKSPLAVAGEQLVAKIAALQAKYGGPKDPRARNESLPLVKAWQTQAGIKNPDGKLGPGTSLALAKAGVGALPLVMFWPQGTTAKQVLAYRQDLLNIANAVTATNPTLAAEIARSAARERGQGGIVGAMPA